MMSPARVSDEVAATAASSRLDAWRCRWSRFFMRRRRCTRLRRATDDTFAYRQSGSCSRAQESRDAHGRGRVCVVFGGVVCFWCLCCGVFFFVFFLCVVVVLWFGV